MTHTRRQLRRKRMALHCQHGDSIETVARTFRVCTETVRKACIENGVSWRSDHETRIAPRTWGVIVDLIHNPHLTDVTVALKNRCSRQHVNWVRNRLGLVKEHAA